MHLFDLFPEDEVKEDVNKVIEELSKTCRDCSLGFLHPGNKGLVWRGNPLSKIAIIGEAPGDKETVKGEPFVGPSGRIFESWMRYIEVDTRKEVLVINSVNCQPAKKEKDGIKKQEKPPAESIKACFEPRTLRVVRAMPNLEVIITMGFEAASALLGTEAGIKTHDGQWFRTKKVPGVAVFCMVHPAYLLHEPSQDKRGRVKNTLRLFQNEYLKSKKILEVLEENKKRLPF